MKFLSTQTFQCGITVQGSTTLAGTTYLTGITNTASWDYVVVGTSAQGQLFTRTYAQLMSDISSGITLSLDGLSDVVAPTPLTGQLLRYNGVQWANWTPTYYSLPAGGTTLQYIDGTGALQTFPSNLPTSSVKHQVKAGVAINKGQAVYVTSADGTNMIVGLASNASEATSSKTMGLLDATVSTNGFANVVTEGLLAGLDTSTANAEGDPVWLGTGGNLIYGLANKPYAPAHLVFIGIVTRKNANNGEIFVKVQNGFELKEIHDVDLFTTTPVNGHILGFDGTLWVNKTVASWLGYTPASASGTTNYISKFTGSTTLGNSLVFDNGTNVGIGTVTPDSRLHIEGNTTGSGSGADAIVHIKQNGGWNGNEPWALYVEGYSYLNGFRVNAYDTQRGLYSDAGELGFAVGGNSPISFTQNTSDYRMYIAPGGNIGIGTTSPTNKLHVVSPDNEGIYMQGSSNGGHWFNFASANSNLWSMGAQPSLMGWYNRSDSSYKMVITDGGNVGIGTTTPGYKLDVNGTLRTNDRAYIGEDVTFTSSQYHYLISGSADGLVTFTNNTVTQGQAQGLLTGELYLAGTAAFLNHRGINIITTNRNTNTSNIVRAFYASGRTGNTGAANTVAGFLGGVNIEGSGNVTNAIGLEVEILSQTSNKTITNMYGVKVQPLINSVGTITNTYGLYIDSLTAGTQTNAAYGIYQAGTDKNYFGGNVGIGTTTPSYKLQVNADGAGLYVLGANTAPYTQTIASFVYGGNGNSINIENQGGKASIQARAGGSTMDLILNAAGSNVGIGTTTTAFKLNVVDTGATYVAQFKGANSTYVVSGDTLLAGESGFNARNSVGQLFLGIGPSADAYFAGTSGATALNFSLGGTSRLYVNSSGNVGIGTSSPSTKLHVSTTGNTDGLVQLLNGDSNYGATTRYSRGGNYNWDIGVGAGASNNIPFSYFGIADGGVTPRLVIAHTTGYVGIGTTNPAEKLSVNGTFSSNALWTNSASIAFWGSYNSAYGGLTWDTGQATVYATSGNKLYLASNGSSPDMTIDTSGNVGIGTTTTGSKLHVLLNGNTSGGPTGNVASFQNSSAGNNAYISLFGAYNAEAGIIFTDESEQYKGKIGYDNISEYMYFQTDGSEKVRITSTGNVGIGVTNPSYKLDVNGSFNFVTSGVYLTYNSGVLYHGNYYQFPSGSYYYLYGRTGMGLIFGSNNAEVGRFDLSGNLGIGTTSPTEILHLSRIATDNYIKVEAGGQAANYSGLMLTEYGINWGWSLRHSAGTDALYISYQDNTPTFTDAVTFTRNGYVGIGTTAPAEKLHVTQNIALGLTGGSIGDTNNILFPTVNGGTHAGVPNGIYYTKKGNWGGQIDIRTSYDWGYSTDNAKISLNGAEGNGITFSTGASALGSTERVRITSDGNVGIGTTDTNLARLRVIGNGGVGNAAIMSDYGNTAVLGEVSTIAHRGGQWHTLYVSESGGSATNVVYVTGTKPVILNAGNVGIGTTSPAYKLDVIGNSRVYGSYLVVDQTNGYNTSIILNQSGLIQWYMTNQASTGKLVFGNGNGDLVWIGTTGNVGIGTNSPSYKLSVVGGIQTTTFSALGGPVQFQSYMELIAGNSFYLFSAGNTYNSTISQNGQNLILNPNTNVGIGTFSPTTKLDVNGVITATGGNSTNWNTAYGWGNHSSAGYVPQARTLTINGTSYDLSANRSWTIATTTPGGSDTQFQYNSSGSLAGASALTYNSANNRIGVNQASPGYDFDVNGQVRVQDKLRVGNVNSGNGVVHMSSSATINPSATTIVWAQNVSVGMCAFIEYYILNSNSLTDQRAGTIMVTWNQSGTPTIAHTETTTPDIGSTIAVNFTSSLVGSDARINAVNSSANPYTIVMSYKYF